MTAEVTHSIKKIELKEEIKEQDLCQICSIDFINEKLSCKTCNKAICITCCNNLQSRCFSILGEYLNIEDKIIEHSDDAINYYWNCSFCRTENFKEMKYFNKKEILKLAVKDYVLLYHTLLYKRDLENKLEFEYYDKIRLKHVFIESFQVHDNIKRFIQFNEELQKTNKELENKIFRACIEKQEKEKNDIVLINLKKEILELKKQHIKEYNIQAIQANINFEQANIIKLKNDELEKLNKELIEQANIIKLKNDELEKKDNELKNKDNEIIENSDNLNKTTLKANGNVLESFFKIDELHRVLSETYNKVKEEFESYLRPSKRESKMYNLFIKTIKQTMKIPREIKTSIDPNNKHQNMEFNNKDLIEYKNNII